MFILFYCNFSAKGEDIIKAILSVLSKNKCKIMEILDAFNLKTIKNTTDTFQKLLLKLKNCTVHIVSTNYLHEL